MPGVSIDLQPTLENQSSGSGNQDPNAVPLQFQPMVGSLVDQSSQSPVAYSSSDLQPYIHSLPVR